MLALRVCVEATGGNSRSLVLRMSNRSAGAARHARRHKWLKSVVAAVKFDNGADMPPMRQHRHVPTSRRQRHPTSTMGMPRLRQELFLQTAQGPRSSGGSQQQLRLELGLLAEPPARPASARQN